MAKHISLIGMMGVGKSSVAPLLAKRLGRQVIEVDQIIELRERMPIGEIFIAKGEAYFRRVEGDIIASLLSSQAPAVLSLGGGAFIWDSTRELLLQHTVVFYLAAQLDVLCSRVQTGAAARPLLSMPDVDWQETMKELLERRGPYYGMAHYRVETDDHTPDEVAQGVLMLREAYE